MRVLQTTTDDDRRQRPLLVCPYIMCRRAGNNSAQMHCTIGLYSNVDRSPPIRKIRTKNKKYEYSKTPSELNKDKINWPRLSGQMSRRYLTSWICWSKFKASRRSWSRCGDGQSSSGPNVTARFDDVIWLTADLALMRLRWSRINVSVSCTHHHDNDIIYTASRKNTRFLTLQLIKDDGAFPGLYFDDWLTD